MPNHVENVAGFEAVKIEALLAHRSQYETTLGIRDTEAGGAAQAPEEADGFAGRIRRQLSEHGALAGMDLGESFHRIEI